MSGSRDFETEEEAAAAAASALQSITTHGRNHGASIPSHNGKSSFTSVTKSHNSSIGRSKVPLSQYNGPLSASLRDKNKKKASYSSRRQKHNESESRRRTRIRHKFSELRVVSRSEKKDRYTVLVSAIERLRYYEARLQELEKGNMDYNQSHSSLCSRIRARSSLSPPLSPSSPNGESSKESLSSASSPSIVENGHVPISVPRAINPIQKGITQMHKIDDCLVLKNVGLALAYITANGSFQDCNPAFCELMGYPKKQLLETTLFALTHPNDLLVTITMMKKLDCGELSTFEMDKKCFRSDGNVITAHVTISSIKLGGKPVFYICFMNQIPTLSPPLPPSDTSSTPQLSLNSLPASLNPLAQQLLFQQQISTLFSQNSSSSLSSQALGALNLSPSVDSLSSFRTPVTTTTTTTSTTTTIAQPPNPLTAFSPSLLTISQPLSSLSLSAFQPPQPQQDTLSENIQDPRGANLSDPSQLDLEQLKQIIQNQTQLLPTLQPSSSPPPETLSSESDKKKRTSKKITRKKRTLENGATKPQNKRSKKVLNGVKSDISKLKVEKTA